MQILRASRNFGYVYKLVSTFLLVFLSKFQIEKWLKKNFIKYWTKFNLIYSLSEVMQINLTSITQSSEPIVIRFKLVYSVVTVLNCNIVVSLNSSCAITFTFGLMAFGKVSTPLSPSYWLNSTIAVLLQGWCIELVGRVFTNSLVDLGLNPGWVIPNTLKNGTWYLLA